MTVAVADTERVDGETQAVDIPGEEGGIKLDMAADIVDGDRVTEVGIRNKGCRCNNLSI